MFILVLDTATNSGGAAVGRNSELIGQVMLKTPLRYSEEIISCVDFLLKTLELNKTQLDSVAVATGPGSFTGLRIGIATAKAFSKALIQPSIGLSPLEALAFRFRWTRSSIVPMIDARRQQIYAAVYRKAPKQSVLELKIEEQVAPPADFLKCLPQGDYLFVGDGAQHYRSTILAFHPGARIIDSDNTILQELCLLAHRKHILGKTGSYKNLKATYLRPSDAKVSLQT